MYRPPAFREDRFEVMRETIAAHPLATLVTCGSAGLVANLVPFTLAVDEPEGSVLRAHLAKANEQLVDLRAGTDALVIFQGPQAYITPSWYPTKKEHGKAVPTWNYVVVQARGRSRVIDDAAWLLDQIKHLTLQQEQHRDAPWAVEDAPAEFTNSLFKGITGVEIPIDRIEGKWKISQNQPPHNRAGIASGLRESDPVSALAAMVDQPR